MSNTWLYGNKAKRKIVMLHIILKPKFCWVTTIVWSTANSSIVTSFRYAVQASASCGVRTATVDWIQSHSSNEQLSFLRNFSSSHTKTSLPHIKRPWIRAPYTKRQLFFQSDFHLVFQQGAACSSLLSQNAGCEFSLQCTCLLFLSLTVAITVIIASTIMRHALYYYNVRVSYHRHFGLTWKPWSTICCSRTTEQEIKHDTQFHRSAPLSFRSNWSDRRTGSDNGSEP